MFVSSLIGKLQRASHARRLILSLGLSLAAAALPFISHAQLPTPANSSRQDNSPGKIKAGRWEIAPGQVLVRFRPGAAMKRVARGQLSLRGIDREMIAEVERFDGSDLVEGLRLARVAPEDTEEAITAFKARPDVLYAEPNYIRHKSDAPNDPQYSQMYGLRKINAEQAWNITHGSRDIVVGVVDEGIDVNHPDLQANIWQNPSDDADRGFPGDAHGWDFVHNDSTVFDGAGDPSNQTDAHGTHVAGTIGAVGNNGIGIVGVNWQVSLMSIKVLGPSGGDDATIIRGYNYAKMMRDLWESSGHTRGANLRVLNNSYGGGGFSQASLDAIRALNDSGILFVAAAGNESANNDYVAHYPASYDAPNVISVAATNSNDYLTFFTNYGSHKVNLAAPGESVLSTTPNNTYNTYSGTSMASPHVAGAAALVCAANPNLNVTQLRAALLYGGDDLASLAGKVYTNRRLNAANALQSALENDVTPPAPADGLSADGSERGKTLRWIAPGDDGNVGRAALYDLSFVDGATGAVYPLATKIPNPAGTPESISVNIPYRHTSGTIVLKTFDNAGNASTTSVSVVVSANVVEPYSVIEGGAGTLSTGGTALHLIADDGYRNYMLPFGVYIFGQVYGWVTVSTNGALYFSTPPQLSNGAPNDVPSSISGLNGQAMVAGLWDDLRTDRRPGDDVYVSYPNADTIVFRWQAVTYNAGRGENPVNFDIELHRDGAIVTHYGDGNANVLPVVGISAGEPDAYVVNSHTSEWMSAAAPINLANASSVTFSPHTFSISGHVASAHPLFTGVRVSGSRSSGASLDINGNYVVRNLPAGGNYTVTPYSNSSIYRYVYTPANRTFNNLSANEVADFTEALVEYSISGRVADANGSGIGGVDVNLNQPNGVTTQTDANGFYAFNNLPAAQSYLVLPSSTYYTFTPFFEFINNLSGNMTVNFTAAAPYSIRGRVVDPAGNGVGGVSLSAVGGMVIRSALSDSNGDFVLAPLPAGGNYTVTAFGSAYTFNPASINFNNLSGDATVHIVATPLPLAVQFSTFAQTYVRESAEQIDFTVARTGALSATATVDYTTVDNQASVRCDDTKTMPGVAFARCDYATTVGTLTFAPGEAYKTFIVPIIEDAFVEGNETFSVKLSNPTGAALGERNTIVITIGDDDVAGEANPISQSLFFVRQQYLDFLSRVPDHNGLNSWLLLLNNCQNVNNQDPNSPSAQCDRNIVSRSFFQSQEFQLKGFFVYLFYKVALNRLPEYNEIIPDMSRVTGQTPQETYDKQAAFGNAFAQRGEFTSLYAGMDNQTYVSTLLGRYNLTQITTPDPSQPDGPAKVTLTNNQLVGQLTAGTLTKARVLRAIVQSDEVSAAEYNRAFVAMQYYGYLRRTPETDGYNAWFNYLTQHPGDYRTMVNGFMNSIEYRLRFGDPNK